MQSFHEVHGADGRAHLAHGLVVVVVAHLDAAVGPRVRARAVLPAGAPVADVPRARRVVDGAAAVLPVRGPLSFVHGPVGGCVPATALALSGSIPAALVLAAHAALRGLREWRRRLGGRRSEAARVRTGRVLLTGRGHSSGDIFSCNRNVVPARDIEERWDVLRK